MLKAILCEIEIRDFCYIYFEDHVKRLSLLWTDLILRKYNNCELTDTKRKQISLKLLHSTDHEIIHNQIY